MTQTGIFRPALFRFSKLAKQAASLLATLLLCSCAIHFTNAENHVQPEFRKIYVPAATDFSARGGNASRISAAVRSALTENTRFQLTSPEEARWGLDIRIIERTNVIESTERCTPAERVIGARAFACNESSVTQPSVTAYSEGVRMIVDLVAIDLRTGAILQKKRISVKDTEFPFPVVANKDTTTGQSIIEGLRKTPELHALRYAENMDNSIRDIGKRIAGEVMALAESIRPPE